MHEWESGRTKKSYVDGCVETLQFCLSHAAIDPSNADDRSRNAQRSDFNPPVMVKRARRDERKEKKSCAACGETSPTTFELAPDIAAQNIRLSWMSRRAVVSPPQLFLEDDIHMNAMPCAAMQWVWPAKSVIDSARFFGGRLGDDEKSDIIRPNFLDDTNIGFTLQPRTLWHCIYWLVINTP